VGLYHVALKIGDSLDELRAAKTHLETHGIADLRLRDHRVSQSIYLSDPDGNHLEVVNPACASLAAPAAPS
jgi:catechol 2,3-dioxygenase